jgi:hypothetical protein
MKAAHYALALAALALPFARGAKANTNCGSPGPNEAIVWEDDPSTGKCDILPIGSYPYSAVLTMSVGNDHISYVSVGSNVKVTLYENDLPDTLTGGDWMPVITSRSVVPDFNDETSSIRVESRTGCSSPAENQVVVWSDYNFSGHCDVVDYGFPVTYAKIGGLSVGNDAISSVVCGSSSAFSLWQDDLFGGSTLQSGQECSVSALTSFNDATSSLEVTGPPETCVAATACQTSGTFCELGHKGCTDTAGTCTTKPLSCQDYIAPSCGCDGRSYANDCERQAAGVPEWYDGMCSSQGCPSIKPQQGASCSPADIACVYTGANANCVERFVCANGAWSAPTAVCGYGRT